MTIEQAKSELMQIYGALSPDKQRAIDTLVKIEPCEDAIPRSTAITLVNDLQTNGGFSCYADYEYLYDHLSTMPSVNPQEPKTGHWIYDDIANSWRCDKCGETPKTMGYVGTADFMTEHFKFCNHCGAKMIEPQESEVQE